MKEYILYVILIFIPIGGLMVYLLRKEGLPGRYINIILWLSLLIILSFPISMEKLGKSVALIIYLLLLAAMTWYLLRARIGRLALSMEPEFSTPTRINSVNTAFLETARPLPENNDIRPEGAKLITLGEAEAAISNENDAGDEVRADDMAPAEKIGSAENPAPAPEEQSEELLLIPERVREDETAESAVMPEDSRQLPASAEEPTAAASPDGVGYELKPGAEPHETADEADKEAGVDLSERQSLLAIITGESRPNVQDEAVLTDIASLPAEEQPGHAGDGEPLIPGSADAASGYEGWTDYELTQVEEAPAVLDIVADDTVETGTPDLPDQKTADINAVAEEQVINLIDNAFACRSVNLDEAVRCFEEAWHLTSDYELRYLLTVELVEIFKESGGYQKAASILDSFIALPGHKSDIINEISLQLDYINLLAAELERLGIGDLPVSRIPRWVRLKVDAEMNPREYR